jgi:hypothetical protein
MILIAAALAVLGLLLAARHLGPLIALLRAAGEMVLVVFELLLQAIKLERVALSALLTRSWQVLRAPQGPGPATGNYWPGWDALGRLSAAVLLGVMVAADYLLVAAPLGDLLGLALPPCPINAPLGLLYVAMGVTLSIAWADACGVSPTGESLLFSRLRDEARGRLATWLGWAVVLVLLDGLLLLGWSVETLLGIDTSGSAAVFLMLSALLGTAALIVALLPALHAPAVVWVFALAALYVLLFLFGTALWAATFLLARVVRGGRAVYGDD